MKFKYILPIIILSLLIGSSDIKAQDPMSLYFLENVPQSNFVNPAKAPRANAFIGIPGVNTVYFDFNTNLPINTLIQNTDTGAVLPNSKYYDFNKLYDKIGEGAKVRAYQSVSPIFFGFRTKRGSYWTFSMSNKLKVNSNVNSDVFKIAEYAFPENTDISFSQTGLDAQVYQEYALGYSRDINKKLRIGGRVKLLQGSGSIKSDITSLNIHTGKYVWNLDAKGDIYSSGPLEVTLDDEGEIDDVDFKDIDADKALKDYAYSFENMGFAIDLGAEYKLNHAWSFTASLNDLGFIKWGKDLNSIHFNGQYDFEGLEIDNDNADSLDNAVSDLMDTIKAVVDYRSGKKGYKTGIGTMLHVGGQYHVNHAMSFGLLSRSTFDRNYFHQEFNVSTNFNLYNSLTANINYNLALNGENYLGMGLALRGGPLQFYVMLDHIPTSYTTYKIEDNNGKSDEYFGPYDPRSFNIMFGFNLLFGPHGFKDKAKLDIY